MDSIKKALPDAKIYFHQTWAYEIDSEHSGFLYYDNNQEYMFDCISKVSEQASNLIDAQIIPVGRAVQFVRRNLSEFNYANGGISLCRDGFHLSYDYGRFLAAAVWLKILTGVDISITEFENFDSVLLKKLLDVVNCGCY